MDNLTVLNVMVNGKSGYKFFKDVKVEGLSGVVRFCASDDDKFSLSPAEEIHLENAMEFLKLVDKHLPFEEFQITGENQWSTYAYVPGWYVRKHESLNHPYSLDECTDHNTGDRWSKIKIPHMGELYTGLYPFGWTIRIEINPNYEPNKIFHYLTKKN